MIQNHKMDRTCQDPGTSSATHNANVGVLRCQDPECKRVGGCGQPTNQWKGWNCGRNLITKCLLCGKECPRDLATSSATPYVCHDCIRWCPDPECKGGCGQPTDLGTCWNCGLNLITKRSRSRSTLGSPSHKVPKR